MTSSRQFFAFSILLLSSFVCANPPDNEANPANTLHLNWRNMNRTPDMNFYAYANGNWQSNNPIPPEYASWSIFNILDEQVQVQIHDLLIAAAHKKKYKPGSIEQKVGDFYFSGMDEKTINVAGLKPLQPEFDKINQIENRDDLQKCISHLQKMGVGALFEFGSMQDFKDSSQMIAAAFQGGLGLPDRDYYLEQNPKFAKIREAYVKHIEQMFMLSGESQTFSQDAARKIMDFETTLAKASMSKVQMRDPEAIYHMMHIRELDKLTPLFPWSSWFQQMGLADLNTINLGTPEFFKIMNQQLETLPLETWRVYLKWQILDTFAPVLSQDFVDQNFKMVQILTGTEKLLPRWKRVVKMESEALGFAIGQLYVAKYFSPESRKTVKALIQNIRQTLAEEIKNLGWMTAATKQAALRKLENMKERVGYPDTWWDYSSLEIDTGPYVLNVKRASEFLVRRDLNKIGKPVDKNEWAMTPQTVNAYYDPSMNNINLPAAILQAPLFDPKAPDAVNYGGIGFVIGHEITHGFDDQGAKFDENGNLKSWWTKTDAKLFEAATDCVARQFSQYKVDDLYLKGKLVVGEASADLGGLTLAWRAFKNSPASKTALTLEGLTPAQQFFLSAAHVWANNIRPEQAHNLVTIDPHPPGLYRVNGTLANMPAFYEAFAIKKPGPMKNAVPCMLW